MRCEEICSGRLYHILPGYPVFPSLENATLECRRTSMVLKRQIGAGRHDWACDCVGADRSVLRNRNSWQFAYHKNVQYGWGWGWQSPMIWLNGYDRRERARIAMQQSNEGMRSGIKLPGAKVVNGHLSARWLMKIACRREDNG